MVQMLNSSKNDKLKQLSKLYRKKYREREKRYVIEGVHLIKEALLNGQIPEEVFVREGFEKTDEGKDIISALKSGGADIYYVSAGIFDRAVDTETPQGIAALSAMPETDFLRAAACCISLDENIHDSSTDESIYSDGVDKSTYGSGLDERPHCGGVTGEGLHCGGLDERPHCGGVTGEGLQGSGLDERPHCGGVTDEGSHCGGLDEGSHCGGVTDEGLQGSGADDDLGSVSSNVVVLDRLQDPGNIGTIIRTADAAGFRDILVMKGTADIFSPKTVRAAAGSLYRVRFSFASEPSEALNLLKTLGKKIACTSPAAEKSYFEEDIAENIALIIGNEANGACEEFMLNSDIRLLIPMEGSIESLNAAAAASIIMYESVRQRSI